MGFLAEEIFRVSPVCGQSFYFPVNIYLCKQTKLHWLKNPRTFQDIFLQFYCTNQKSQLPLGLWIITYLSLYTLDLYIICIGKQENLTVIKIGSLGWNLKSGMVKKISLSLPITLFKQRLPSLSTLFTRALKHDAVILCS